MSTADIVLLVILLFGAYRGYKQGFLMELFSLVGIVLGILGGFKLMGVALIYVDRFIDVDEAWLPYVAFGVVFLLILISVVLIGKSIKASIDDSFLGRVDETAGAALGIFKSAFIISVLIWLFTSLDLSLPENWTANSYILPFINDLAPKVSSLVGSLIPPFDNLFE